MIRTCSEFEYDELSEGGTRFLFRLDRYEFRDVLDGAGRIHHFVLEDSDAQPLVYEVDRATMYELMARYLAGEYEKREYGLERSPAHEALLDTLELATAQARTGTAPFPFDALEEMEEDGAEEEGYEGNGDGAR